MASGRPRLRLCNGMVPFAGYVFDHVHGWLGRNFSFDFATRDGGEFTADRIKPWGPSVSLPLMRNDGLYFQGDLSPLDRSVFPNESNINEGPLKDRIHLVNLHYQGHAKAYLPYDVCRALHSLRKRGSAQGHWQIQHTAVLCEQVLRSHQMNVSSTGEATEIFPCLKRESRDSERTLCF